ncbi:hypothetical protein C0992_000908, partial [Termitomyces sp. T32_za158]
MVKIPSSPAESNSPRSLSHMPVPSQETETETFLPAGPDPDPDPWVDDEDLEVQPLRIPAMQEEPYIRLAYLNAVYGNVYGKESWETATEHLKNQLNVLELAGRLPEFPRPVRSLVSARKRLGIDPDVHIIQYAVCPKCWKHHTPQELKDLAVSECQEPNCSGTLYTIEGTR